MEKKETIETIEMEKLVDMSNNGMSLQSIAEKLGTSKSTVQRRLVKDGYIRNKITGKYENNISIETMNNGNNVPHKTNVSSATSNSKNIVNRTYAISEEIDRAIKIKSAIEGKKPIDIVREALESYIESKYLDM
jgi:IS30 family transposase